MKDEEKPVATEMPAKAIETKADVREVTQLQIWESRLKDSVEDLEAARRQLEALEAEWPAVHREGYSETRGLIEKCGRDITDLIAALRTAHLHATGAKG